MALGRLLIALAVVTIVIGDYQHEVETENKTKKTLASEKEQKSRSANPGREKGSFHKLNAMLNKTDDRRQNRRKGKDNLSKIHQLNLKHNKNQNDDMMNDNEGAISNHRTVSDNDTNSLTDKIKVLRREGPTYEAVNKNNYVPQVTGVYCDFENASSSVDMCMWSWNSTTSSHGLGFRVSTAADVVALNQTTRGLKFSGPTTDADENVGGEI